MYKIGHGVLNEMISNRMKNLHPYVPGEQPKDREYIKLNANENPYKPSPKVVEAVVNAATSHSERLGLYPDPDSNELKSAIAKMLNETGGVLCRANVASDGTVSPSESDRIPFEVTKDMVFCGNGSDEVLSFVFYSFFDGDRELVLPEHTYSFYPVYAGFYQIPLDKVPLKEDWTLDTEKMLSDANGKDSSVIFANPNAPTGLSLTRDEVRRMIGRAPKDRIFVVDEAYVDFGGESAIPLIKEFDNLVVVRTFSKSLCGAGQRLGYIVSNPKLIECVTTVKNSFNHFPVDFLTQTAGIAACSDVAYYVGCAKKVASVRDDFVSFLRAKGWFVIDSCTNFVFAKKDGVPGEETYRAIKADGILVRHFSTPGIEEFLRITIGTEEQMEALKKIMEKI